MTVLKLMFFLFNILFFVIHMTFHIYRYEGLSIKQLVVCHYLYVNYLKKKNQSPNEQRSYLSYFSRNLIKYEIKMTTLRIINDVATEI